MTNSDIIVAYQHISGLNLSKVKDKAARKTIVDIHMALYPLAKKIIDHNTELRKAYGDEILDKALVAEFNARINEFMNETAETPAVRILRETLLDICADQDYAVSCADLVAMQDILEE